MYSIRAGHKVAINRINTLITNAHDSEALVTAVFTVEKILRRILKQLIISAGFTSKAANILMEQIHGAQNMKEVWICFDPEGEELPTIIGSANWQTIPKAITMRDKLIQGVCVYNVSECKTSTRQLLITLQEMEKVFQSRYGFSGWEALSVRKKSMLHIDARVKI